MIGSDGGTRCRARSAPAGWRRGHPSAGSTRRPQRIPHVRQIDHWHGETSHPTSSHREGVSRGVVGCLVVDVVVRGDGSQRPGGRGGGGRCRICFSSAGRSGRGHKLNDLLVARRPPAVSPASPFSVGRHRRVGDPLPCPSCRCFSPAACLSRSSVSEYFSSVSFLSDSAAGAAPRRRWGLDQWIRPRARRPRRAPVAGCQRRVPAARARRAR